MICPKCYQSLDDSCLFCPYCGAALDAAGASTVPEGGAQESSNPFAVGAQTTARSTYGYADGPAPDIPGFGGAIKTCFSKSTTFSGRASRSEYWYWQLLLALVHLVFFLSRTVGTKVYGVTFATDVVNTGWDFLILLPSVAVQIRRLHDAGRSGWWWLLGVIPCFVLGFLAVFPIIKSVVLVLFLAAVTVLGWLILLIFNVMPSDLEPNKYGPPPMKR